MVKNYKKKNIYNKTKDWSSKLIILQVKKGRTIFVKFFVFF